MKNINNEEIAEKLKIFFKIFEKKPNLLVKFIVNYDVIDTSFLEQLSKNVEIEKQLHFYNKNKKLDIKFFKDLVHMQEYYNSLFKDESNQEEQKHPILGFRTRSEMLVNQLKTAIVEENFEKAANLRDYIKSLDINIEKYL